MTFPNEQSATVGSKFPFFARNGLKDSDREICDQVAQRLFPGQSIAPVKSQGWCSYTMYVSPEQCLSERLAAQGKRRDSVIVERRILQFRPQSYALNVGMQKAAKEVYGSYVPAIEELGSLQDILLSLSLPAAVEAPAPSLRLYGMECISGTLYSDWRPVTPSLSASQPERQARLVHDFASFIAQGWLHGQRQPPCQPRKGTTLQQCTGTVGRYLVCRLQQLAQHLPSAADRQHAARALQSLHKLDLLPAVVQHGDVLACNVMMQPETGALEGLVDWAEAEVLPFGVCLLGLEHLLGWMPAGGLRFNYYRCADALRRVFWERLVELVPELRRTEVREAVLLARDLGVLLWHGIAWDEGRRDRVVNEKDDGVEVAYLRAFLGIDLEEP